MYVGTYAALKISGPNPTIASYNASVVNFYNATGSLVCFEKKIFVYFEKRSSLLQRKFKNRRIGSCICII
jgi:hypothetical protein